MGIKRSQSHVVEDDLRDLLTYTCPYTGRSRCPPNFKKDAPVSPGCNNVTAFLIVSSSSQKTHETIIWNIVESHPSRVYDSFQLFATGNVEEGFLVMIKNLAIPR